VTRGGIDIHGGDVRAARDIVAGDVNIAGNSISGQTVIVQQGFSPKDVQRLILIVGTLVVATAALFFIIGAVAAAPLVAALNRPLDSSIDAARSMQNKIAQISDLPAGQEFVVNFSEDEVSSFFRFLKGPENNISDGKGRFLETPGQVVFGGNLDNFGGLPFMAVVNTTTGAVPLQLESAWLKIIPTPQGVTFGWIPVTPFAQGLSSRIASSLFGDVTFTEIRELPTLGDAGGPTLRLWGVVR
jgi:hypothetical protein